MTASELEHHLLGRIVFDGAQLAEHHGARGWQLVRRQSRATQQISIDGQCRSQVSRQRRAAEAGVGVRHRGIALDTQIIEIVDKLPAIAIAGAAQGQLAGERAESGKFIRLHRLYRPARAK